MPTLKDDTILLGVGKNGILYAIEDDMAFRHVSESYVLVVCTRSNVAHRHTHAYKIRPRLYNHTRIVFCTLAHFFHTRIILKAPSP